MSVLKGEPEALDAGQVEVLDAGLVAAQVLVQCVGQVQVLDVDQVAVLGVDLAEAQGEVQVPEAVGEEVDLQGGAPVAEVEEAPHQEDIKGHLLKAVVVEVEIVNRGEALVVIEIETEVLGEDEGVILFHHYHQILIQMDLPISNISHLRCGSLIAIIGHRIIFLLMRGPMVLHQTIKCTQLGRCMVTLWLPLLQL